MAERVSRYLLDGLIEPMTPMSEGNARERADAGLKGANRRCLRCSTKARPSFMQAPRVIDCADFRSAGEFCSHLSADVVVQSDAFIGLRVISKSHEYHPKVTLPAKVASWLPKVHVLISNP